MKSISCNLFLLCFITFINILQAQNFTLVEGAITSTLSDSRSVNFIDLNNDGWEDIYISNGLASGQADLLYLNDGAGNFTQITDMEVVQVSNPSDGASFVDYNNDGHLDGVITSWHNAEDLLYLNDGNGNLNYNEGAGIVPGSYAETAAFGDYDNDGWLDLYITNSGGNNKNFLYRNTQDGKFERILDHTLVNDAKLSRGAIWGDFNGDKILDLFVVNEGTGSNDLFLGQGGAEYTKVTSGALVTSQRSTMTASWGDIDNDGDFDVFIGNSGFFNTQLNQLFLNTPEGYVEVSEGDLVETSNCTFGSAFGDYDNDGDLDLLIANGFCNSNLSNALYVNQGDGTFVDSSQLLTTNPEVCSFGIAWGDINNDGFLDLMSANCKNTTAGAQQANTLLLNSGNDNHYLKVKLTGVESNRSGVGALVRVKATINGTTTWQIREVRSQTGYAGQNSLIAHFGLGDASQVDSIVIDWPSGIQQVLLDQAADQQLNLLEDQTNAIWNLAPAFDFSVFPNPIKAKTSELTIKYPANLLTDSLELELINANGKLVQSWTSSTINNDHSLILHADAQSQLQITIADQALVPGIYFLLLRSAGSTATQQLIVK